MSEIESDLEYLNRAVEGMSLADAIAFVTTHIKGKKVFSTSFGIEDQLLTHYVAPHNNITVFTLDTGRQFNETYEVFQKTQQKYPQLAIETYYPLEEDIREYTKNSGINGFYDSIEKRKSCCYIRKVKPLQRALSGASLWITGLRAEQSANRNTMRFLEWDESHKLIKFNPLLHYKLEEVEEEVKRLDIPVNSLYYKGYLSIGCAPCTRALAPGEDFRAGRWWWENGKKECGLHIHADKNF